MLHALLVLIVVLALAAIALQWDRWAAVRRLRRGARVVETACGAVECAVVGSGPPVLLLHGGMGGWDQGVALGVSLLAPVSGSDVVGSGNGRCDGGGNAGAGYHEALRDGDRLLRDRFTVIAPSRVGYLRTPLASGETPAACADAVAALLDELGIDRVAVVGVSGGGPTALQFALRHGARAAALVMVAAIAKRHVQPDQTTESLAGRIVFNRGFGWLLDLCYRGGLAFAAIAPSTFTRLLLGATETFDRDGIDRRMASIRRDPSQIRWMRGLLRSGYPLSARKAGLENDLRQFAAIEAYPLAGIRCPTLVVHGRHDGNVTFDHAEFVAGGVAGSRLMALESCGHLIWMSEEVGNVRREVAAFIGACLSG